MKKILVPTDFSKNANNALRYAINIANHFEAEIHLVNVYEVRSTTGSFKSIEDFMKEDAEKDLSKIIKEIEASLHRSTTLRGRAIKGFPVETICSIAKKEKMDLIVMGTQGASGLKEIFLGSNAEGVMKNTLVPLIAVPNEFQYRSFKEVLFPVDSGIVADTEILKPLIELSKAYRAKVKVFHLETEKAVVGYDPGIEYSLKGIDHSFESEPSALDINQTINFKVVRENIDLICMIRRERGFWERLFHRSVTQKEIFHSPVPLLILHSED